MATATTMGEYSLGPVNQFGLPIRLRYQTAQKARECPGPHRKSKGQAIDKSLAEARLSEVGSRIHDLVEIGEVDHGMCECDAMYHGTRVKRRCGCGCLQASCQAAVDEVEGASVSVGKQRPGIGREPRHERARFGGT